MKLYIVIITILIGFSTSAGTSQEPIKQQNNANGGLTGTVVLTPKNTSSRFGGGMYGRPGTASSTEASTDSVLVILLGSQNSSSQPRKTPVLLDQKNQNFVPKLLPIKQNQQIRIRNSDPVYHNVFSLSSTKKFDVGRRPKGEYLDVTFDKTGVVDVFCDIHSNMHAVIYVMPANAINWTKVKSGDSFNIDDLPPGNYELKFYAGGYQEISVPLEVSPGEVSELGTITMNS